MTRSRLVLIVAWTSLAALLPACAGAGPSAPAAPVDASRTAPSTPSTGTPSTGSAEGDVAVWSLQPGQGLRTSSTRFSALVSRLGCNGGVTGQVLPPEIRRSSSEVVVTFAVAPKQLDAATCPGNDQVPYEVDLGEPLQGRSLVDGACLPGAEAATTAFCLPDGVRFKP